MELLGVDAALTGLTGAARRVAHALLTMLGLVTLAALYAAGPDPVAMLGWLDGAARLQFGLGAGGAPPAPALAAAAPATALLTGAALSITALVGWGGGLLLVVAEWAVPGGPHGSAGGTRLLGRVVTLLVEIGQGLPIFWVGGVLVGVLSVGLGWLPPGGIAAPDRPAFGTAAYLTAPAAHPAEPLGDLLAHLALPAVTLALAGLATDLRLVGVALPAHLAAPHTLVARGTGLSRQRVVWRAARPALPMVAGGVAAGAPLLASALLLVEYLYGWPGLGLLAYHAARAGDNATLAALLLVFGSAFHRRST